MVHAVDFSMLEELLNSAPLGMALLDPDTRFLFVNKKLSAIDGIPQAAHIGRRVSDILPGFIRTAKRVMAQGANGRMPIVNEEISCEIRGKPGIRHFWRHSWYGITGADGQLRGFATIVEDITERRRAEDSLRYSEERFRILVESVAQAVWEADATGMVTSDSPTWRLYTGQKHEELLGAGWLDAVHPDDRDRVREAWRNAVASRKRFGAEFRIRHGMQWRWTEAIAASITGAGGAVRKWIGMNIDITERRHQQAVLDSSEARLQAAMSIPTVGILFFELDGHITNANGAFQRMVGYSLEELRSISHWERLTAPEHRGATARAAEELATTGQTAPYEKELLRKDGSRLWGLFAPTRLDHADGGHECVEFIIDITAAKRFEQELKDSRIQLARALKRAERVAAALGDADRRKDQFLATLAHELRNPLAPIRNGLEILRLSTKGEGPPLTAIEMMDRQLRHLVHLVDDLLDVGRIASGKLQLKRRNVDLAMVLANSIESCQTLFTAHGHEVTVEMDDVDAIVYGDFDRLTQVFGNLLCNAAKYSADGGHVAIRMRREHGEVVVQVLDNGIGIPPDALPHVFDLFSQVREHQGHAEGGLGIGLALVQHLVLLHGGSVTAESRGIGHGSAFTVRLPLAQGKELQAEAVKGDELITDQLNIVVADDSADAAQSLALLMRMLGHQVHIASDGAEAVEQVKRVRPDLAVLDLGMPNVDGYHAAEQIRALPGGSAIYLVALTGWGQEKDRQQSKQAGFDVHLVKPLDLATLRSVLARLRPRM